MKMDIEKFKKALKSGPVSFAYKKKDGTLREAFGTLSPSLIPPPKPTEQGEAKEARKPRKLPEGIIIYYDLSKASFRSFNESQLESWDAPVLSAADVMQS